MFALVSPLSIAATNMAWVAAVLLWLYEARLRSPGRRFPIRRTELDPAFGLLLLASLLSLFVSAAWRESLLESRSLGLIVICYLFAWEAPQAARRRVLVFGFLGSAGIAAVYGIVQSYTDWDFLGHFQPGTGKASGFFSLHLTYGEYMVLAACLAGGVALWAERIGTAARAAALLPLLLMGFAVLTSGAKGAFLGL
ncbi:MAG: hypothetical protein AB1640_09340, partial [bacterium]